MDTHRFMFICFFFMYILIWRICFVASFIRKCIYCPPKSMEFQKYSEYWKRNQQSLTDMTDTEFRRVWRTVWPRTIKSKSWVFSLNLRSQIMNFHKNPKRREWNCCNGSTSSHGMLRKWNHFRISRLTLPVLEICVDKQTNENKTIRNLDVNIKQ